MDVTPAQSGQAARVIYIEISIKGEAFLSLSRDWRSRGNHTGKWLREAAVRDEELVEGTPSRIIPLTVRGTIALKVRLHRGLTENVPRPLFRPFLKIRSRWPVRRSKPAKENV